MSNSPSWYSIQNSAETEADVMIYDAIGAFGISAEAFVKELKGIRAKTVNVRLNTPGGSVFDGNAIHNALRAMKARKVVHVDGVAASIGSVIAMAGDEIRMAKNAYMMIHNPHGFAMGGADELRKTADLMDKLKGTLAQTYADRTGRPRAEWEAKMDAETWFDAQEAVDAGLADTITEPRQEKVEASWDIAVFNSAPAQLKQAWEKKQTNTAPTAKAASCDAPGKGAPKEHPHMDLTSFKAFAADHPDAVEALIAPRIEAFKAEANKPATVNELRAAFPNAEDNGFVIDQMTANATLAQAHAAFAGVLSGRLKAEQAKTADLTAKLAKATAGFGGVDFSAQKPGEEKPDDGEDPIARFNAKVAEFTAAGKSKAQAISAAVAADPQLHAEYVKAVNRK